MVTGATNDTSPLIHYCPREQIGLVCAKICPGVLLGTGNGTLGDSADTVMYVEVRQTMVSYTVNLLCQLIYLYSWSTAGWPLVYWFNILL
jgi:hypothetical protein